jgi:hypothetical protein
VILPADGDSLRGSGDERSIGAAQSCNVHALAEKAKIGNEFMSALKRCEVALACKGPEFAGRAKTSGVKVLSTLVNCGIK